MNKKQKYKTCREYRDNIRILYKEGLYYEGYELCLQFKSAIENEEIEYTDNDLWACCIYLSIGCEKLGLFNMATYYAKLSLMYARKSAEFFKSKLMLGVCYQRIKKYKKAIETYDSCIQMCDKTIEQLNKVGCTEELKPLLECKADCLHNKGEILNDEISLYQAIKIYKALNYDGKIKNEIIQSKIKETYEHIKSLQSGSEIKHLYNAL